MADSIVDDASLEKKTLLDRNGMNELRNESFDQNDKRFTVLQGFTQRQIY